MRANRYFGLEARLVSSCPTTLQVSIGHSELIVFESDRAVHSFPCRLRSYHPRALPLRALLFMLFMFMLFIMLFMLFMLFMQLARSTLDAPKTPFLRQHSAPL